MTVDYRYEFGLERLNRRAFSEEGADSNEVQSDPPRPDEEAKQESEEIKETDKGDTEDLEGQEGCGGGTACYASSSFRNPPKGMSEEAYEEYKRRHPEVEIDESLENHWSEEELLQSLEDAAGYNEEESVEMKLEKAAKKAFKQSKKSNKLQKKSEKFSEKAQKKFGKVQNKVAKVGSKIAKKLHTEDDEAAARMKKKHEEQAREEYYRRHPEYRK